MNVRGWLRTSWNAASVKGSGAGDGAGGKSDSRMKTRVEGGKRPSAREKGGLCSPRAQIPGSRGGEQGVGGPVVVRSSHWVKYHKKGKNLLPAGGRK